QSVGLHVVRLVRIRLGPLVLGNLKSGESRQLRPAELAELRRIALGDSSVAPSARIVAALDRPVRRNA
ncbi:MAG TPA: hypothetical protein VKT80_20295, partial [Chloroflexota bacterium]|nr:hypothetical protein [Chloroflexota bacterium]